MTLRTTLLAAFAVLLSRYARETDFILGLKTSNRQDQELPNLIGAISNLLPLRIELSPREPFLYFLARLETTTQDAGKRAFIPFERA